MTAREIYFKETGKDYNEGPIREYFIWLEKQVENGQKTKGEPESFEDTTLKDFLKMMENLDRLSSVCFYSDGSGDVVNNENNSELGFDNLEELGELLKPKLSLGDKVTCKYRNGTHVFLRYNKIDKRYVFISDGETERAVVIDHVTKLEP